MPSSSPEAPERLPALQAERLAGSPHQDLLLQAHC